MGGDFNKLRALRVLRRKYAAALDGHADGARGAGKLIKCVDRLFIRIFSQQQPNVLPPRGADAFRIALRAGEKLPGLQERAANLVVNAGLGAQNFLFPRRFLYVLPILPKPPVHAFQAKIVLFHFPLEPRFLGDIRAGDLVNAFSCHLHLYALKAQCLAILQRDDRLRFNRFPENVRVEQRFSREQMTQFVHFEVLQAGQPVFPRKTQRAWQMVTAFLDGNRRKLPPAFAPQ